MKIIQVHNYYQQAGGEDSVVEAERLMLEAHGNIVIPFYKDNEALGAGLWALVTASVTTLWNWETYCEFRKLLQCEKPDVVHCHNTFPLISPSIYWACAKEKVPVVQTLHNYRMLCLNAFLFRSAEKRRSAFGAGHQEKDISYGGTEEAAQCLKPKAQSPAPAACGICELCVSKSFKWPGVKYGCYRESRAGSLVVALMLLMHKLLGTWTKKVTAYIALTEFQKQKMIEGGLPAGRIFVKPNFIADGDQAHGSGHQALGDVPKEDTFPSRDAELADSPIRAPSVECPTPNAPYCLFVGRLSPEKGCDVLIRAWSLFQASLTPNAQCPTPSLLIVGDGPERDSLEKLTSDLGSLASVNFLGKQPKEEVLSLMRDAAFLVFPSVWYETFGLTVLEAGMQGTASIVSSPSTTAGMIEDLQTGRIFEQGNDADLAEKLGWAFANSDQMRAMGKKARADFENKYSAEVNYQLLMGIYGEVRR
jgi:glycosyltransferase involved in cell wall biosynthesis